MHRGSVIWQSVLEDTAELLSATTVDYERALTSLCQLAVPEVADWCAIDMEKHGQLERAAAWHPDASVRQRLMDVPLHADAPAGREGVFDTGEPALYPSVSAEDIPAFSQSEDHLALMRELGLQSLILVPVVTRRHTIGVMTFASATVRYDQHDLAFAHQLVARAALGIDNARLYVAAQDALRLRDAFLAVASHELLTPVTALKGNLQMMRRSWEEGQRDEATLARRLTALEQGIGRLEALMKDLLDVSRIRQGSLIGQKHDVDLAGLLREDLDAYRSAGSQAAVLSVQIPDAPCHVDADEHCLKQVLVNLLDNAVKYSPSGGSVAVELDQRDRGYELAVRDEGIGLVPGTEESIFQPFGRSSNTSEVPGTGLGLYICRHMIEAHGGRISAHSDGQGKGTTIRVWLPASRVGDAPA